MTQDISTASIGAIYRRTLVPDFAKVGNLIDSQKFFADTLELAKDFILDDVKNFPGGEMNFISFLDHELQANLNKMMHGLPDESFTYAYLALIFDFRSIQNLYTRNFGNDAEEVKKELSELEKKLILKDVYHEALHRETEALSKHENIFEYLSHIDHIFFEILILLGEGKGEFITNFIAHKIDSYNMTAYVRLKNLGRSDEFIREFLIEYPHSIAPKSIHIEYISQVLAEFVPNMGVVSANLVEVACQTRELSYLKKSIFEGVDEPAIIFYLEIVKAFFFDLKVLTLGHEMHSTKNEILPRLVNYSLIN